MPAHGHERWLGPDDDWHHSKPWFRESFKHARRHGWLYKTLSGHSVGRVYCRDPALGETCSFPVFSSGRAGETASRDLVRLINYCDHPSPFRSSTWKVVEKLLRSIDGCLDAAEELIEADRLQQRSAGAYLRAEELLAMAAGAAEDVDALIGEAVDLDDEARVIAGHAREMLAAEEVTASTAEAVLDIVEADIRGARQVVRQLDVSPRAATAKGRLKAAKLRLGQLRTRLSVT